MSSPIVTPIDAAPETVADRSTTGHADGAAPTSTTSDARLSEDPIPSAAVGRIIYLTYAGIQVVTVRYRRVNGHYCFITNRAETISQLILPVTFEVDWTDPVTGRLRQAQLRGTVSRHRPGDASDRPQPTPESDVADETDLDSTMVQFTPDGAPARLT